jgi:hypothetical protein
VDEKTLIDSLWPALEPPRAFSARVLSALDRVGPPGAAPKRRVGLAAVGLVAVAALALLVGGSLFRPRPPLRPGGGEVQATVRETLSLGGRAVAVAEEGAQLGWTVSGGRVRVEQRRGAVFYRVDHGTPFVVSTSAAEVTVTGTCFQVEVGDAVSVRVFEGEVSLGNRRSVLSLQAGERGRVEVGRDPVRVGEEPAPVPGSDGRVARLEHALAEARQATPPAPGPLVDRKFIDLSADELKALGARCELRYARPEHLVGFGAPDLAGRFGLDERERMAVVEIMEDQRTRFVEELRAIYGEIVGDPVTAAKLSPVALVDEINAKSRPGEDVEARNRLFDEWTGKAQPPTGAALAARPPVERFWRLISGAGDVFVRRLTEVVGHERASAIARGTVHDSVLVRGPCGRFKAR